MPTLLDVHAIPRGEKSRTRRLHDAFLESYLERHPGTVVETVDLAKEHDQLPVFDEWDIEAKFQMMHGEGALTGDIARRWEALTTLTDQLHRCDVLVVSAPMWNFSIPWQLKRWIDAVVQPRLTFEIRDGGYQGLLGGRKAVLLLTRDGAYSPGTPFAAYDHATPYLRQLCGFLGFSPIVEVIAEPLGALGPEVGERVLEAAIAASRKAGTSI